MPRVVRSTQLVAVVHCRFHVEGDEGHWVAFLDDVTDTPVLPMLAHMETLLQMHCPCYRCGAFVDAFEGHVECGAGPDDWDDLVVLRVPDQFVDAVRQSADAPWARAKGKAATAARRAQILEDGRTHTRAEVRALHAVQGGRCFYCYCPLFTDARGTNVAEDHFTPLARGGHDGIDNIVLACRGCNARKLAGDGFKFLWSAEDAAPADVQQLLVAMHQRHRAAYPALWALARGRRRPRKTQA